MNSPTTFKKVVFFLIAIKKGKFNHMKKLVLTIMSIAMLSGCATAIKCKTKDINMLTNTGEEAEVNVVSASGTQTVVIPSVVNVKKDNRPITITVKETKCNRPTTTVASEKVELWTFGNVLFWIFGTTGTTVDAMTGAMWDYDDSIVVPVYHKNSCPTR